MWLLLVAFVGLTFAIYAPALDGSFISDDEHYVEKNVYVHDPTGENLVAILDPGSALTLLVENYAPVHLLLHAAQWQFFGPEVRGYHVVNLLLHALAAWLLFRLFLLTGIAPLAAALGCAFFLVHPANVEAVAWISQLKTSAAMVLALGALLAHPRRPALAALLFGLALLAKPTAIVALPVVVALGWVRSRKQAAAPVDWHWKWVAGWSVLLAAFALAEWMAFSSTAGQAPPFYAELDVRLRSVLANALRYLVRAVSGFGVSVFQEPPPADSWRDPWWLASLPLLAALGWRTLFTLRRGRYEAVWWIFAIAGFAPISGVIPLPYPMADRYLYFMLPGLIGGSLLAGPELARAVANALRHAEPSPRACLRARSVGAVLSGVAIVFFSLQSYERSHVWQRLEFFMAEAARNYPEGVVAKTREASRAALEGNAHAAVAALRAARARGYNRLDNVNRDPAYRRIAAEPVFRELIAQWASEEIARLEKNLQPSQQALRVLAQYYLVQDDLAAAERSIRRAIERGGPLDEKVRVDLEQIERQKRIRGLSSGGSIPRR